uniref:Uncharacterized protein n=1 Tax=Amphimedon queenslandica TaxID=400682 RepID=A0A1X7TUY5_AMPQE
MAEASDIQNLERNFEKLNDNLPEIAKAFSKSVSEVKELVNEATTELQEIRESHEVKKIPEVKISYQHLKNVSTSVTKYLEKVSELYQALQNKTPGVIQGIKNKDFEESAELFIVVTVLKESVTGLQEKKKKQTRARVAGGATTVGATVAVGAGGITASIVAGILTGGIGFAVVLPIAIGATAATTVAAGATTAVVSHKYGKAAESFRKLGRRFRCLHKDISTVQDKINAIDLSMNIDKYKAIKRTITAKIKSMTAAERNKLTETLKKTKELANDLSPEIAIGLNNAENAVDHIQRQIDSTF